MQPSNKMTRKDAIALLRHQGFTVDRREETQTGNMIMCRRSGHDYALIADSIEKRIPYWKSVQVARLHLTAQNNERNTKDNE